MLKDGRENLIETEVRQPKDFVGLLKTIIEADWMEGYRYDSILFESFQASVITCEDSKE
jgi:hypothetical protein